MDQTKQSKAISSLELLPHPGETLQELLTTYGMSQKELAARIDVTPKHINEIVSGKKGITSLMAHKLSTVFNLSAKFWNTLQADYDEEVHQIQDEEAITKAEITVAKRLPYDQLQQWGYLPKSSPQLTEKVIRLRAFLGVTSLLQVSDSLAASDILSKGQQVFKMSQKAALDPYSLALWLRMCTYHVEKTGNPYDRKKLKAMIPSLRKEMLEENLTDAILCLTQKLKEAGIDFQVIHAIPGAPVQGYLRLLGKQAILRLTLRFPYEDVFWFSFFHEIGHLLSSRNTKQAFLDFEEGALVLSTEEEANAFAENTLISQQRINDYFKEKGISEKTILSLAKEEAVPPAIIVGRLGHQDSRYYQQYSYLRRQFTYSDITVLKQ
jgi:HTH-type transcriptional regulator/antitoxin HigA